MKSTVQVCKSIIFYLVIVLISLMLVASHPTHMKASFSDKDVAFSIDIKRDGTIELVGGKGSSIERVDRPSPNNQIKGVDVIDLHSISILGVRKNPHYYISCGNGDCYKIYMPH